MNKNIADYLPYYIGQDIQIPAIEEGAKFDIMKLTYEKFKYDLSKVKLYLRPLSDMTVPEATEMKSLMGRQTDGVHPVYILVHSPYSFSYLLKQGFDLFGLIEAGLAMDKTKEVRNAN